MRATKHEEYLNYRLYENRFIYQTIFLLLFVYLWNLEFPAIHSCLWKPEYIQCSFR